jgi:predicted hotdog family 3-hydroxylacyl-ACP dehydratase
MIDAMLHYDDSRTTTSFEIRDSNLFLSADRFTSCGVIENIAQTCAARIGFVNKFILKKDVQIGYIGAIRNLDIFDLPKVGQQITTVVDIREEAFGMTLASATVKQGEQTFVTTEMKIAVKNNN